MEEGHILYGVVGDAHVFKLVGDVRQSTMGGIGKSSAFYDFIHELCKDGNVDCAVFDCRDATGIDSTYLGLMAQVAVHIIETHAHKPVLVSTRQKITELLHGMGFDALFLIVSDINHDYACLKDFPEGGQEHTDSMRVILQAHKTLASMNEQNRQEFQNVINILEQQST